MDERAWVDERRYIKSRASRQLTLIASPIIAFLAVTRILEPMDYPAGDIRNSIVARLVFYGAIIVLALAGAAWSARWLRAHPERPPAEPSKSRASTAGRSNAAARPGPAARPNAATRPNQVVPTVSIKRRGRGAARHRR